MLFAQPTWATFDPLNLTATTPNIESTFITVDYVVTTPGTATASDIESTFITVDYNATADVLTASGFAIDLTPPGSPSGSIVGGSFDINATINDAGIATGGALTIGGTIPGLGFNSGTVLTGTLSAFAAGAGDPLEFQFDVTGGDAAGLMGTAVEVTLTQSGYAGSFASNFTSGAFQALSNTVSPQVDTEGVLTASGFAIELTPPGSPSGSIAGGSFDITAAINDTLMAATGSLTIGGTIAGLGFNSGTLLTGSLSALGAGSGDPLEFLLNVTGGDAAGLMGAKVGVNLSPSGYTGSFANNFTGGAFQSLSDTFSFQEQNQNPLPAPGTLVILVVGIAGIRFARRK